jgi:hypothetical protein
MLQTQLDAVIQPRHLGPIALQHHSHTSGTGRQRQTSNRIFRDKIARRGKDRYIAIPARPGSTANRALRFSGLSADVTLLNEINSVVKRS